GRARSAPACAALLGIEIPAGEATEARRGPPLLPPGRCRAAAADTELPLRPGLYDQGRAEAAARGRAQNGRCAARAAAQRLDSARGQIGKSAGRAAADPERARCAARSPQEGAALDKSNTIVSGTASRLRALPG